jgi:hypothetical protein
MCLSSFDYNIFTLLTYLRKGRGMA